VSIVVQDFHKNYADTIAAAGISFAVSPGEILGLLGPNGAGKTTTLRALVGILTPTRGRLLLDGHDVVRDPIAAKAAVAYVPDDPQLFDRLTVWEHFRFVAATYQLQDWRPRAEWLLLRLELVEKRNALASELSRGMRQKLAVGCGYLHRPPALLLDEPFTGPDPRGIRTMKDLIREAAAEGAAVIVSSHLLSLFEDLCTSILILHRGRVRLHGRLEDLRRDLTVDGRCQTLEELFFQLTEGAGRPADELAPAAIKAPGGERPLGPPDAPGTGNGWIDKPPN
jgi:ABC-2 type transport system ATP-binding protein